MILLTLTARAIICVLLKSMFDPGFTTKGAGVGTGLGLAISYRIIQGHEGASEVGKGSVFTVRIPLVT